ncbi:hypothetical protein NTJ56_13735 [Burkholderia contaminans]|uniref:hypothetical protein n=1 Tax=Burkholderia contaminans TaxID=488447 RepID=UPI001CF11A07|nr:hypothetical protein [Burkholderia contaminans]MCA7914581.1 hypothetical protein [Burkholderia contaminans]UUX36401.1 hypothetical protein NTJ56_13735 [Burkholderia contaminans]
MNEPENDQLAQLHAEVQKLRAELQSITKSMQLRDADTAAVTAIMQAMANMTLLAPQISEPFSLVLREVYKVHRDKPKVTALYREHFDNAFKSLLPDHLRSRVLAD